MNNQSINISILRPGGNDTALVEGIPMKSRRKQINDFVLKLFPTVEQVGFFEYDRNQRIAQLEMAGSEFCGNATRSLAYLLLQGKKGTVTIKASGTKQLLLSGIKKQNSAFCQMPIKRRLKQVRQINEYPIVELDGITHVIVETQNKRLDPSTLKRRAESILGTLDLLEKVPASGVMFLKKSNDTYSLEPVVWVTDIRTLFYETACASGTTAAGIYCAQGYQGVNIAFSMRQPSGMDIRVSLKKDLSGYVSGIIDGPISVLSQKRVTITL